MLFSLWGTLKMANQVTYTNLFSESRNNVVALITVGNVPDPNISSAESRKWIYSREPDVKANDFKGYPYIVVHHADTDIEMEKGKGSLDGKSKSVFWEILVDIVTSDRGYGEKNGQGSTQMETISNNLIKTFNDITNRNTLSNNSMKFCRPTTTSVVPEVRENELVFVRSILLAFESRIKVSA